MKYDVLQFTSLLTWWWLPSLGSRALLSFCYSASILTKPPAEAYRRRNKHLQLSRSLVIVATLVYQLLSSISAQPPNYYQLLALPLDVDAEGVKRSFRALARRYHPDKVGSQGEEFFIVLRRAHDALSDPVKRFAYDRFGSQITDWKECETPRDFMRKGLTGLVAFYTINPAMYAIFGYLNSRSDGVSFWRIASLFSLLSLELTVLISPDYPTWLAIFMPNTTIHDFLTLAHSLFLNFFFASLHLSAALDVLEYGEESGPARDAKAKTQTIQRNMDIVRLKSQSIDKAAEVITQSFMQSLAAEMRPFRHSQSPQEEGRMQRSKSPEEERIFDHIHDVLLTRGVLHRQPRLAQLAAESIDAPLLTSESDEGVNTTSDEQEEFTGTTDELGGAESEMSIATPDRWIEVQEEKGSDHAAALETEDVQVTEMNGSGPLEVAESRPRTRSISASPTKSPHQ